MIESLCPKKSFFYSTNKNYVNRIEAVDITGRPIFSLLLSASISPRATDEGIAAFFAELEALAPQNGSLAAILRGLPGYRMVHLFDKGFL